MNYQRRDYDELRRIVSNFLDEHHPSGRLPIPIEEIVEFQLRLDIVPIPGLRDRCQSEANGFLARGRDAIFVDQFVAQERENRYRFTLAYEVGRYVLQESIVGTCKIHSLESYLAWHESVPDYVWRNAKFECYDFAGLLLIPTPHLNRQARHARDQAFETLRAAGREPEEHLATIWSRITAYLADKVFQVSSDAMKRRLQRENLIPPDLEL